MSSVTGAQPAPPTGVLRGATGAMPGRTLLVLTLAYVAVHFGAVAIGYTLRPAPQAATVFWPPAGLLLTTLFLTRRGAWPALIAAAMVAELTACVVLVSGTAAALVDGEAVGFAALGMLQVSAIAGLCQRWTEPGQFLRARGLLLWLLTSAVGVGACACVAAFAWVETVPFALGFQRWFGANFLGILIVSPVVITVWNRLRGRSYFRSSARAWEAWAFWVVTIALTLVVFSAPAGPMQKAMQIPYILIPLLAAAAARLPLWTVTLLQFAVCLIAVACTNAGLGHFAGPGHGVEFSVLALQVYLATIMGTVLLLAQLVAEHSRAFRELAESEDRYRLYVEQTREGIQHMAIVQPMPLAGLDVEQQIDWLVEHAVVVDCNRAYLQGLRLDSKQAAVGRLVQDSLFPDNPGNRDLIRRFIENDYQLYAFEYSLKRSDGSDVEVIQNLVGVIKDGHLVSTWSSISDITRRKRAERRVRTRERQFRALIEGSIQGITISRDYQFLFANAAMAAMLDFATPEALRDLADFRSLIAPADRARALSAIDEWSAGDNGLETIEIAVRTQYGEEKTFEVRGQAVEWEAAPALQCVFVDITARKAAEAALDAAYEDLELKVRERTEELAGANARLQELDRLKSLFIATMSHELRTPLNSIIGFSSVLLKQMTGPLNPAQLDQIRRIADSGRHLLGLITEIIDISKIEAGRVDVHPENLRLVDLCRECADIVQQTHGKAGIELRLEVDPAIALFSDRSALSKCLINLLSNAWKYSEAGEIVVDARVLGDRVVIDVQDSGIGIAAEDMDKLFMPFERLESHLAVASGGTGLGLYIVKRTAESLLDGSVTAASSPGAGSCFTLTVAQRVGRRHVA